MVKLRTCLEAPKASRHLESAMAAASLMRWSSFSLNPRAPEVAETSGYKDEVGTDNSSELPLGSGLHPAAADLQHNLAENILDVDAEDQGLASAPLSQAEAPDGRWDTEHLPKNWFSWKKLWRFTGPGFLMSIAYIVSPPPKDHPHLPPSRWN